MEDSFLHSVWGQDLPALCPLDDSPLSYFKIIQFEAMNYACRGFCGLNYGVRPANLNDEPVCHLSSLQLQQYAAATLNKFRGRYPEQSSRLKAEFLKGTYILPESTMEQREKRLEELIAIALERNINLAVNYKGVRFYDGEQDYLQYEKMLDEKEPLAAQASIISSKQHSALWQQEFSRAESTFNHLGMDFGIEWHLRNAYFDIVREIQKNVQPVQEKFGDCVVRIASVEDMLAKAQWFGLQTGDEGRNPQEVPIMKYPLRIRMDIPYTIIPCQKKIV